MKRLIIFFVYVFLLYSFVNAQKPTYQSNPNLDFNTFLSGVRYAVIQDIERLIEADRIVEQKLEYHSGYNYGKEIILETEKYLKEMNFEKVFYSTDNIIGLESYCDLVKVTVMLEDTRVGSIKMRFIFQSCNNDIFEFISKN